MNGRIELVGDDAVQITGRNICIVKRTINGLEVDALWTGDRDAVEALLDTLQCYLDTGAFAALADTSSELYLGKKMRRGSLIVSINQMPDKGSKWCKYEEDTGSVYTASVESLRPLSRPEPKVRPYTPAEAAAHLGRSVRFDDPVMAYELRTVSADEVVLHDSTHVASYKLGYKHFASYCWADDSSPCGVVEK